MSSNSIDILFVDDQWCKLEERCTIVAAFGPLFKRDIPYVFHYETAEEMTGRYSVRSALNKLQSIPEIRAVILDVVFGADGNRLGLEILESIRDTYPILPVFIMTSLEGDIDVVERAMELGANEYLIKKPTLSELETALRTYIPLPAEIPNPEAEYALWGNSQAIRHVRSMIARVAYGGTASVLITGESGTGKELVARAIHRQGPRRRGPFEVKNCAHAREIIEIDSDLFGYEKGAFTGAEKQHIGRIERANGGVLFLDEVGMMSRELQGKLLRVLETKTFQRIGGTANIHSDFQLICATNEDPQEMLADGRIRHDLYYRINQFQIHVPPLGERKGDVEILSNLFLQRFKAFAGASYRGNSFSAKAMETLRDYSWPGNARELKNIVERVAILAKNEVIDEIGIASAPYAGRCEFETQAPSIGVFQLPEDITKWSRTRIQNELCLALAVKKHVLGYKKQWKAEFMRLLYPECKAQSAKGFDDLIRRLTKGPWGDPNYQNDPELAALIGELEK